MKKSLPYLLMILFALIVPLAMYINAFGFSALPRPLLYDDPRNPKPIGQSAALYKEQYFPLGYFHDLTYYWLAPQPPYPPGVKFPLVIYLHGTSGNFYAADFLASPAMQIQFPSFVAAPILPSWQRWGDPGGTQKNDGLGEIVRMIAHLKAQYPIDPDRVYVVGCSEGGTGAFAAARYYPDVFAAALPMSATWNPVDGPNLTKVPIWAMHGQNDTRFPAGTVNDTIAMIKSYGGRAYFTEFPAMDHNCAAQNYYVPQIWQWMFQQRRNGPAVTPAPATSTAANAPAPAPAAP